MTKKLYWSSREVPGHLHKILRHIVLVRFEWHFNFLDTFLKNTYISNFIKIRAVGGEFHAEITKLFAILRTHLKLITCFHGTGSLFRTQESLSYSKIPRWLITAIVPLTKTDKFIPRPRTIFPYARLHNTLSYKWSNKLADELHLSLRRIINTVSKNLFADIKVSPTVFLIFHTPTGKFLNVQKDQPTTAVFCCNNRSACRRSARLTHSPK